MGFANPRRLTRRGSSKFKLYNYDYQEITSNDINNINNFLGDNNLGDYSGLSLVNKISVDLDNDNREESIYTISNMYMDGKIRLWTSLIFILYGFENVTFWQREYLSILFCGRARAVVL